MEARVSKKIEKQNRFFKEYLDKARSGDVKSARELIRYFVQCYEAGEPQLTVIMAYVYEAFDAILDDKNVEDALYIKVSPHRAAGANEDLHIAMAAAIQYKINMCEPKAIAEAKTELKITATAKDKVNALVAVRKRVKKDAQNDLSILLEDFGWNASMRTIERACKEYEGMASCFDEELLGVFKPYLNPNPNSKHQNKHQEDDTSCTMEETYALAEYFINPRNK